MTALERHGDPRISLEVALTSPSKSQAKPTTPWVPEHLIDDRFQVVRELGRGGMGAVYVVFDRELCRELALKRIHPEHAGRPDPEERFRREYRALAAIRDPGVPQVHHTGRTPDGAAWFTMEIVRGESLRTILDRGPVTPARAVELAIGLGKILAAAHEAGVVHRDVKPNNVMVEPGDRVRLLDFGACTPLSGFLGHAEDRRRTADVDRWESSEGLFAGTYGYSDPATHDGSPATVRSDIFSLAAIFYELLAGRRLFDAQSCTFRSIDSAELPLVIAPVMDDLRHAAAVNPYERPYSMTNFVQRLEITRGHIRRAELEGRRVRPSLLLLLGVALGITAAVLTLLLARTPAVTPPAPPSAVAAGPPSSPPPPGTDPISLLGPVTEPPPPPGTAPIPRPGPDTEPPATPPTPGTDPIPRPGPVTEPPAALADPTASTPAPPLASATPGPSAPVSPQQRARRLLARRTPAISRCVDDHGAFQTAVAVALDLDAHGRVGAVRLVSGERSALSRCVSAVLSDMSFAPGLTSPLHHTFPLEQP